MVVASDRVQSAFVVAASMERLGVRRCFAEGPILLD